MNYYEAKEFIKSMHKDSNVSFSFDDSCIVRVMTEVSDGYPQQRSVIFYNKLRADVEGAATVYIPLSKTHAEMDKTRVVCDSLRSKKFYISKEEYESIKILKMSMKQTKNVLEISKIDAILSKTKQTLSENTNRTPEEIDSTADSFNVEKGSVDLFLANLAKV